MFFIDSHGYPPSPEEVDHDRAESLLRRQCEALEKAGVEMLPAVARWFGRVRGYDDARREQAEKHRKAIEEREREQLAALQAKYAPPSAP